MSLTLLWNGITYHFESRSKERGVVHHNARLQNRIKEHIYLLHTGMLGTEPRDPVILKIARDAGEIAALELEAALYQNQLKCLQGKYVPRFYGIYHGEVDGSPVVCMLLEYCIPGTNKLPLHEKNRKVMLAACAIHEAGIMHCDLEHGHHFIMSGSDVRVVDFSCAVPHRCYGATPTLHPGMGGPSGSDNCRELMMLERCYGIFSGESIPRGVNAPIVNPLTDGNPLSVLARRVVGMMM
ncbi:hypothetical protein B0H19DRAFT_325844 [Mycena capillaripes]|nr:hypothetical protein B0H19DRAFT_325844 [Mycena capillaripes]